MPIMPGMLKWTSFPLSAMSQLLSLPAPMCLQDPSKVKDLRVAAGLDNLLYSADTYFSCFADLALVSPVDYYK